MLSQTNIIKMSNFFSQAKIHEFLKIYIHFIIHTVYIFVYKHFTTTLDKCLRKSYNTKRDREIGQHKVNEMRALNMKQKR